MIRWLRLVALAALIMGFGCSAHAQSRADWRWLADPELLVPGFPADVRTMAMVDAQTGWASSGNILFRFDGRHWRIAQALTWEGDTRDNVSSISFADPSHGWAAGASWHRTTPTIKFWSYDGTNWTGTTEFRSKDGRRTATTGSIYAVQALPGGQAMALGSSLDQSMLFKNDGTEWIDITPASWPKGRVLTHLAMVSATEGWASAGSTDGHALLSHFKNGVWEDVDVPALGKSMYIVDLHMNGSAEGWAVANTERSGPIAACQPSTVLHYRDTTWTIVESASRPITAFALVPGSDQGWVTLDACSSGNTKLPAERRRFDAGRLLPDLQGATLAPRVYSLLDVDHQYAAYGGNFLRWSDESLPTAPLEEFQAPGTRYFPATGHSLDGAFLHYYANHGLDLGDDAVSERESLALFGYPISQPFREINPDLGDVFLVQYFERARMEYHPENPEPYTILLGRLTVSALNRQQRIPLRPSGVAAPGCLRNDVTLFDLCPPLLDFWDRNGNTPVFGHPISQAQPEISLTDSQIYSTQYFERGRMEHHPEYQGSQYEVLLGLLGSEELSVRGYLPR